MRMLLDRIDAPVMAAGATGPRGRSIIGNAGLLITRCCIWKQAVDKNFCIVDAAMNDLMPLPYTVRGWTSCRRQRPGARRRPVRRRPDLRVRRLARASSTADSRRRLHRCAVSRRVLHEHGQQLRTRGRAAEVLMSGANARLIRDRENEDVYRHERLLPNTEAL